MLDFNHVVNAPNFNIQIFNGGLAGDGTGQFHTWNKPRGSRMLWMIAVGGGGAGGNSNNNATSAGGGGGGGSGGQSSVIIPSAYVPDILYVQAGNGGVPSGTEGGNGGVGGDSAISIERFASRTPGIIGLLYANGGSGGVGTTGTGAGTGGAGGTVFSTVALAGRGIYQFFAGQSGTAGGNGTTPTAGTNLTLPTNGIMVTGGTGGGGKSSTVFTNGGDITGVGSNTFLPTIAGGAASGIVGRSGTNFIARNFLMNYGGTGGGAAGTAANNIGLGGNGGDGSPGAGGGGAGASATSSNFAFGGNGGPGFVMILSW